MQSKKSVKISNYFFAFLLISFLNFSCQNTDNPTNDCGNNSCPAGYSCVNGVCQADAPSSFNKEGEIKANETWKANNIYTLTGKVIVKSGVTLTIEPGTIIKGKEGEGSLATALIIAQGGKLIAKGTAEKPIIFTSILDNIEVGQTAGSNLTENNFGLWGGLIILGQAPISALSGLTAQIEGIPANETYGIYGGEIENDNSGILSYVSVRHGGANIGEGNEINGITLGGVGSGTTIENVEVVGNKDDGIEFFGGTVNVKNAIVWGQGDDAFDIDQAYKGQINNVITIASSESDSSFEIDGPEGEKNSTGSFAIINASAKGNAGKMADFRDGAQGTMKGVYFFNYPAGKGIQIKDDKTNSSFLANKLIIGENEFNQPNQTIADIFKNVAPNGNQASFVQQMITNKNIIVSQRTGGANPAVFDWTLTNKKGQINNDFK